MATIKRKKVSSKNTSGVKRETIFRSKKFWIIFSSIAAVIVAAVVVTIILVNTLNTSKTKPEVKDYFAGESENLSLTYNEKEVTFTKATYDGVRMHTKEIHTNDDTFIDYIFVFAIDLDTFYPDSAINDGLNKDDDADLWTNEKTIATHLQVFNNLVKLQGEIDAFNEKGGKKAELFIVDTGATGNNTALLADTNFGGSEEGSSALFALIDSIEYGHDPLMSYKKDKNDIATTDLVTINNTSIKNSIELMKNDFVSIEI